MNALRGYRARDKVRARDDAPWHCPKVEPMAIAEVLSAAKAERPTLYSRLKDLLLFVSSAAFAENVHPKAISQPSPKGSFPDEVAEQFRAAGVVVKCRRRMHVRRWMKVFGVYQASKHRNSCVTSADLLNEEQRAAGYAFDPPAEFDLADPRVFWGQIEVGRFAIQST